MGDKHPVLTRTGPQEVIEGAAAAGGKSHFTCLGRPRANIFFFIFSLFMCLHIIESLVERRCRGLSSSQPSVAAASFSSLVPVSSSLI